MKKEETTNLVYRVQEHTMSYIHGLLKKLMIDNDNYSNEQRKEVLDLVGDELNATRRAIKRRNNERCG